MKWDSVREKKKSGRHGLEKGREKRGRKNRRKEGREGGRKGGNVLFITLRNAICECELLWNKLV